MLQQVIRRSAINFSQTNCVTIVTVGCSIASWMTIFLLGPDKIALYPLRPRQPAVRWSKAAGKHVFLRERISAS